MANLVSFFKQIAAADAGPSPLKKVMHALADSDKEISANAHLLFDPNNLDNHALFKAAAIEHRMLYNFYTVLREKFTLRMRAKKSECKKTSEIELDAEDLKYLNHQIKLCYILFHVFDKHLQVGHTLDRLKEDQKRLYKWLDVCKVKPNVIRQGSLPVRPQQVSTEEEGSEQDNDDRFSDDDENIFFNLQPGSLYESRRVASTNSRENNIPLSTNNESLISKNLLQDFRLEKETASCTSFTKTTVDLRRNIRLDYNIWRLLLVRFRRACLLLAAILGQDNIYSIYLSVSNKYIAPWFSLGNWLFFVPRLSIQVYLLGQHVFFPSANEKKYLSYWQRFIIQMSRRSFDLLHDIPWLCVNFALFYCGVSVLSYTSVLINFAMMSYDLLFSGLLRAYWEDGCWQELLDICNEKSELQLHSVSLEKRYAFEKQACDFSVFNFTVILLSFSLSLPIFYSISPWLGFIGSISIFLMTIVNWLNIHSFDDERQTSLNGHPHRSSHRANEYPEPVNDIDGINNRVGSTLSLVG